MHKKSQKQPRKHHTVPVVYLQNFTDENGQCWVLNHKLKCFHNIPANILNRKDFNTITFANGEKSYLVEKEFLSNLEGGFGTIVEKIKKHQELDMSEKEFMAYFIAAQLARTENRRLALGEFLEQLAEHEASFQNLSEEERLQMAELSDFIPESKKKRGTPISEVLKIREDMSSHQAMSIPYLATTTYGYILEMNWVFLVSEDREFFTSDDPVSLHNPDLLNEDGEYGIFHPGLAQKSIELTFPITKNISLMATYQKRPDMKYVPASDLIVKALNERQTRHARQLVFSNEKDLLKRLGFAIQYSVRNVLAEYPEVQ